MATTFTIATTLNNNNRVLQKKMRIEMGLKYVIVNIYQASLCPISFIFILFSAKKIAKEKIGALLSG